jgi:heme-degrading monooxygenase HmoA
MTVAVTVLVQRDMDAEKQEEIFELLRQLRSRAVLQPGYLSGETLFSANRSGAHMVISKWRSFKDWRAWEKNTERREILSKIDSLLKTPAVVGFYLDWVTLWRPVEFSY